MPKDSLFVFAHITPKEEHFEDAKQAILGILDATREESGCLQFELHEDPVEKHLFLYEEWTDASALEEHYQKPYTSAVFESYQGWLAAPVDIVKMRKCRTA